MAEHVVASDYSPLGLTEATLLAVQAESQRAVRKHGTDRTPLSLTQDDSHKLAILGEEYGEVCRALTYDNDQGLEHLMAELIQTASVAACWAQAVGARIARAGLEASGALFSET